MQELTGIRVLPERILTLFHSLAPPKLGEDGVRGFLPGFPDCRFRIEMNPAGE